MVGLYLGELIFGGGAYNRRFTVLMLVKDQFNRFNNGLYLDITLAVNNMMASC